MLSLALEEGPQARLMSCSFESTAPRRAQQDAGDGELLLRQANGFVSAGEIHGFQVQREVAHGERLEDDIALAPREGAQVGQKLGGGEGLGHVIVGAGVVAADLVADGIAGSEQQDGGAHVGPAQALGHGEAVGLGQHDVQDDDVVGARPTVLHASLPIVHDVGGVAIVLKDAGQRLGEAGVVFHDQNVHGDPFRKGPPPRAVVRRRLGGSVAAFRGALPGSCGLRKRWGSL